jgi:hypothetical protein
MGEGGREVNKQEWQEKNGFFDTHCCDYCAYYHDAGEELLGVDEFFCKLHGKNKKKEIERSFCREMLEDDVDDYYLEDISTSMQGCNRFMRY